MLLGLLSDTHDHADAMAAGLALLRKAGAEFFIHCGDIGGQRCIDLLAGLPAAFVWGNTDWDRDALAAYAQGLGVACHGDLARLTLGGKRVAVTHGDNHQLMRQLQRPGECDYLIHGHTHVARDERVGSIRLLNPGALHRASRKTVATLDTQSGRFKLLTVVSPPPGGC